MKRPKYWGILIFFLFILSSFIWAQGRINLFQHKLARPEPILLQTQKFWDIDQVQVASLILNCKQALQSTLALNEKLVFCPEITSQIVWETPAGLRVTYPDWPEDKKERLALFFNRLVLNEENLGVQCPQPRNNQNINMVGRQLFMTEAEAFDIYSVHVAHALFLESLPSYPFSLLNIPSPELAVFFDSSYYHSRIRRWYGGYAPILGRFQVGVDYQRPAREFPWFYLSCDPRWIHQYLRGRFNPGMSDVLGWTEEETLRNLSDWFYHNAVHGPLSESLLGEANIDNYILIQDRLRAYSTTTEAARSFNAVNLKQGCHSAANLMFEFARTLNLPLLPIWTHASTPPTNPYGLSQEQHMGLAFHWSRADLKVLQHIDDLYTFYRPFFPIDELGRPIRDEQRKSEIFFNTVWLNPERLAQFHFLVSPTFPKILPGEEFLSRFSGSDLMEYSDQGNFGGYWQHLGFEALPGNDILLSLLNLEQQYQICSWPSYLKLFCEPSMSGVLNYEDTLYYSFRNYQPVESSLPSYYSARQHALNASACIEAYGGCNRLREEVELFYSNFGLGVNP